ncbi:MAG: SAM-dependent methyltransferase [Proteobacteria bacterium]|nr:SAM-dependent methyltransferase [Pseudomonadota bacterium]
MTRFIALAAISAAVLAYEVLLTRLFAIIQWHHFAFLAISIALLGFGVSGAALALWRSVVEPRLDAVFSACALTFAVASPVAFFLAQRVPFNALELVWNPWQLLNLGAIYLVLVVPFTAGAACIGIAFLRREDPVGRVYFWNLLGSAVGALGMVFALSALSPVENLAAVLVLGLIAAAFGLAADGDRCRTVAGVGIMLFAAAGWVLAPTSWMTLRIAEHKGLPVALNVTGAELVLERFGPLGLVSVVESPLVPFRSAPGLSLNSPALPPEQIAVFTDADAMTTIDANAGRTPAAYLRNMTNALVYSLMDRPNVLVLNAGGGRLVAQALAHTAARIDAVEPNPNMVKLVRDDYAAFAGHLYDRDEVTLHVADARGFLAATERQWDIIVVEVTGSSAGAHGLNESYLLTVNAITLQLRRLRPGGWLSFTQALKLPPRGALKLILTALAALERRGATSPADHLVLIRGIATTTLLVGRDPVSAQNIAATAAFAEARSFDLAYYPGMLREKANRFNILADPVFFDAAKALTGPGRAAFVERYKFDIAPATDNRPYFHDFFRWRSLPELLAMRSAGGAALLELGELVLMGALGQALLISLVLVLLPLLLGGLSRGRGSLAWSTAAYFTAIGFAFFFIEIAFIQKFILFLGHPSYAFAVVLAGFLVFAGLGARVSERFAQLITTRFGIERPTAAIDMAVAGMALVAIAHLLSAPAVFAALSGLPTGGRALVSLTLIAPLAFFMGMPFPLGLTLVRRADPALTPWAWGVNGCASVNAAILAMLLSMHLGYVAVVVIALVLYAIATRVIHGVVPGNGSSE